MKINPLKLIGCGFLLTLVVPTEWDGTPVNISASAGQFAVISDLSGGIITTYQSSDRSRIEARKISRLSGKTPSGSSTPVIQNPGAIHSNPTLCLGDGLIYFTCETKRDQNKSTIWLSAYDLERLFQPKWTEGGDEILSDPNADLINPIVTTIIDSDNGGPTAIIFYISKNGTSFNINAAVIDPDRGSVNNTSLLVRETNEIGDLQLINSAAIGSIGDDPEFYLCWTSNRDTPDKNIRFTKAVKTLDGTITIDESFLGNSNYSNGLLAFGGANDQNKPQIITTDTGVVIGCIDNGKIGIKEFNSGDGTLIFNASITNRTDYDWFDLITDFGVVNTNANIYITTTIPVQGTSRKDAVVFKIDPNGVHEWNGGNGIVVTNSLFNVNHPKISAKMSTNALSINRDVIISLLWIDGTTKLMGALLDKDGNATCTGIEINNDNPTDYKIINSTGNAFIALYKSGNTFSASMFNDCTNIRPSPPYLTASYSSQPRKSITLNFNNYTTNIATHFGIYVALPDRGFSYHGDIPIPASGTYTIDVPNARELEAYQYFAIAIAPDSGVNYFSTSDPSNYATVVIPPDSINAPSNLAGRSYETNKIVLTWQVNSTNNTGLKINKSTDGINFTTVFNTTDRESVHGIVTGLPNSNETFTFEVKAYFSYGSTTVESPPSNRITITNTGGSALDTAPIELTYQQAGNNVTLRWKDTTPNEDKFEIWRSFNNGNFEKISEPNANSTSFADNNLSAGQYKYKMRSRFLNPERFSTFTNIIKNVTVGSNGGGGSNTPPNAPGNLFAVYDDPQFRVALAWSDNSNNETGFEVQRKDDSSPESDFEPVARLSANTALWLDTEISDNTAYSYRVRAFRLSIFSAFSNVVQIIIPRRGGGGRSGGGVKLPPPPKFIKDEAFQAIADIVETPHKKKKVQSTCFIATGSSASYSSHIVTQLSNFRNSRLISTSAGRISLNLYSKLAPSSAVQLSYSNQARSLGSLILSVINALSAQFITIALLILMGLIIRFKN